MILLFLLLGVNGARAGVLLQDICEKTHGLKIITKAYEVRPEMIRFITESVSMDLLEYLDYKARMIKYLRQACFLSETEQIKTGRVGLALKRKAIQSAISAFIMLDPNTSVSATRELDYTIFMSQTERYKRLNPLRVRILNRERLF